MMTASVQGLLIHQIVYPLTVLGPGTRVGIWFQGCTIHCPECIAPETWEFDETTFIDFQDLKKKLHDYQKFQPDGITISGGEPFDQPQGLIIFLTMLREMGFSSVMVYSGYPFEFLRKTFISHLDLIDILVSEPFQYKENDTKLWRGSDNQIIHLLSKRAKQEYNEDEMNELRYPEQRSLQIIQNPDSIFIAGIPKRADLDKLRNFAKK